jgi:hypothetical protein
MIGTESIGRSSGFLCLSVHWRPDPEAANPEMPGHKLSMSSYIPVFPTEACLCGRGKRYGDCCQPKHLWHSICPNPGGEDSGYSLLKPQKATFRNVDGDAIRERLMADRRLCCTDTSRARCHGPHCRGVSGFQCYSVIQDVGRWWRRLEALKPLRDTDDTDGQGIVKVSMCQNPKPARGHNTRSLQRFKSEKEPHTLHRLSSSDRGL